MIAAGVTDDASPALIVAQLCDGIRSTTQLKAADGLQALWLQIRCSIGHRVQPHQWGMQHNITEPFARFSEPLRGHKVSLGLNVRRCHSQVPDAQNSSAQISRMIGMMKGRLAVCFWM
jgi:hypothetical protein